MKHLNDEMLSAYANDELSPEQRKHVEKHIQDCADCRKKLNDFKEIRDHLMSINEVPAPADGVEKIMAGIKETRKPGVLRRWRIPAFVAVPLILVLALLMTLRPWNSISDTQGVIAKASTAMAGLDSYRISVTYEERNREDETSVHYFSLEYSAPDRYHTTQTNNETDMEQILIDNQQYYRNYTSTGIGSRVTTGVYASMLDKDYAAKVMGILKDVKKLSEETINGTHCLHYSGVWDEEKALVGSWELQEKSGRAVSDEAKERMLKEARQRVLENDGPVFDLWIGKDDYLLREMKQEFSSDNYGFTMDIMFYDFNQPVEIKAPLDSNGELLPGWTSPAPLVPNISADIQSEIDNSDPSHRKIDFNIILTNVGKDTLTGADVMVGTDPVTNRYAMIGYSWHSEQTTDGPYSLEPSESLKYSIHFLYDATTVRAEDADETISSTYIEISYFNQAWEQKTETFHLPTPDALGTLSDELPQYLVPLDLTPAGEYRINEPGASDTGSRTTGVINGKEYLFILVGTRGSETPAPPGLLVLDIDDKTTPEKISYTSTPGNVEYSKGNPALYGTVLYLSTDSYLWVLDVSNPADPVELAILAELTANQIIFSGNYAFINENNHHITTLDISDPAKPERVGSLWMASLSTLHLHENYLYTEVKDVLYTIDISDLSSLETINEYPFSSHVAEIGFSGDYAYIGLDTVSSPGIAGSSELLVLDISDPAGPEPVGSLELKDQWINGQIYTFGDKLYTFTRRTSGLDRTTNLIVIDISKPANPKRWKLGVLPDFHDFFEYSYSSGILSYYFIDNYLYWFISNSPNQPVIEIFDLSGDLTGE
jgi:hypothetical protein